MKENMEELLSQYLDKELDDETTEYVRQKLASDPEWQLALDELQITVQSIRELPSEATPERELWPEIVEAHGAAAPAVVAQEAKRRFWTMPRLLAGRLDRPVQSDNKRSQHPTASLSCAMLAKRLRHLGSEVEAKGARKRQQGQRVRAPEAPQEKRRRVNHRLPSLTSFLADSARTSRARREASASATARPKSVTS